MQTGGRRTRPIRVAEQQDAFTRWRRFLIWKPGERKGIKRRANRVERREFRDRLRHPSLDD